MKSMSFFHLVCCLIFFCLLIHLCWYFSSYNSIYQRHKSLIRDAETLVLTSVQQIQSIQKLITDAVNSGMNGAIVEVGVWKGATLLKMADVAPSSSPIIGIDVWEKNFPFPSSWRDIITFPFLHSLYRNTCTFKQAQANCSNHPKHITLLNTNITKLIKWDYGSILLLRCDVDTYDGTLQTLKKLAPYVRSGGYIVVDDYHNIMLPVKKAVSDYMSSNYDKSYEIKHLDNNAVLFCLK